MIVTAGEDERTQSLSRSFTILCVRDQVILTLFFTDFCIAGQFLSATISLLVVVDVRCLCHDRFVEVIHTVVPAELEGSIQLCENKI